MALSALVNSNHIRPNIRSQDQEEPWGECEGLRDALTSYWYTIQPKMPEDTSKGIWHSAWAGSPNTQVSDPDCLLTPAKPLAS